MKNKKILLEFLPSITYLLCIFQIDKAQDLSYRDFEETVSGIVWNVDVLDEIKDSKNLTDNDKKEINSFLSSIKRYCYGLRNGINENVIDSLDDEVNGLSEYCNDNNIEIVCYEDEYNENKQ